MKLFKSSAGYYITLIVIAAALLLFNGNFFALVHNSLQLKKLNRKVDALDIEYIKLSAEYEAILKGDTSYVEDSARTKYHMALKDEVELRLPKTKK